MVGGTIGPKLLFLVTEDWYFRSHRLPIARAARVRGFDVVIATHVQDHEELIRREGFKLIPIRLSRKSRNPLQEVLAIVDLIEIYRKERPDIVHHVAMKPVLYGSIAAHLAGIPYIVNALAGMGYVFTSNHLQAKLIRPFIKMAFAFLLGGNNTLTIVQNPDDFNLLQSIVSEKSLVIIKGSGVDTGDFKPSPNKEVTPVVLMASRMLWDKGVGEFVAAAKILQQEGVAARFVLVGDIDHDNPSAVPAAKLKEWHDGKVVEYWGHRKNMLEVFQGAHIACLPSYREGLPKVLLEAAACGLPIVTTDTPGCREIVRDQINGLLVPVKDIKALALALKNLIMNHALRLRMGERGRTIVENEFSLEKVVDETISLYNNLLQTRGR
ncbi:MAG TPA: glycosyltransferase family 1 protein [Syntrophus sp. (in: bacteria)]|nr:glycosyltransferase family 1 protein [Syntrophus sp. (in: bacteria)]